MYFNLEFVTTDVPVVFTRWNNWENNRTNFFCINSNRLQLVVYNASTTNAWYMIILLRKRLHNLIFFIDFKFDLIVVFLVEAFLQMWNNSLFVSLQFPCFIYISNSHSINLSKREWIILLETLNVSTFLVNANPEAMNRTQSPPSRYHK